MPWKVGDVDLHNKGLSDKQKKLWVSIANKALADGDEDSVAIRKANAAVGRMKKSEAFTEARDVLVEIGRTISTKNMETITTTLSTLQNAIEQLNKLMSATEDKVEEAWSFDEAGQILAKDESFDSVRYAVQAALRLRAQNDALAKKLAAGQGTGEYEDYYYSCYPYISDLYSDYVVYRMNNELYQCTYTMDSDKVVTLGDPIAVQISYVPMSESEQEEKDINIDGDLIELTERAVADDGSVYIKLISPGWGSSGYYSEKVLKRDGPKIFKKGLHMYVNHPTEQESNDRPERDLNDLAGVLLEDASYDENGQTGPGLYAKAKVFKQYRDFIDEAAPFIGTSIRAWGRAVEGEADGRYGMIVNSMSQGHSVDYVTLPGRGGQVLPLLEAARTNTRRRDEIIEEVIEMDESKVKELIESALAGVKQENETLKTQLSESNTSLARMKEALVLRDAREVVVSTLRAIDLPDITRNRLAESCAKNPPVKEDGSLDTKKLVESVKESAKTEIQYLASAIGSNGKPVGMGTTVPTEITDEDVNKALTEAFSGFGLSDKGIEIAVNGRR